MEFMNKHIDDPQSESPEQPGQPKSGESPGQPEEREIPRELQEQAEQLDEALDELRQSPEFTYEQKLRNLGISRDEAAVIVDQMLSTSGYERTYKITGRAEIKFKTRSVENDVRLASYLEDTKPVFQATFDLLVARHNLAASTVSFAGRDMGSMSFDDRLEWASGLPRSLLSVLATKLSEFDKLVNTVMDEGAIENF